MDLGRQRYVFREATEKNQMRQIDKIDEQMVKRF